MGIGRSGRAALLAVVLVAAAPAATACGSCDVACAPAADVEDPRVLTATVLDVDNRNGLVQVESDDGREREFRVNGRIEVLDRGTTYLFPVTDGWVALPDPCDCGGPYVTDLDGDVVDTAYLTAWRNVDVVRLALSVVGIGAVLVTGWAVLRRRRGLPL